MGSTHALTAVLPPHLPTSCLTRSRSNQRYYIQTRRIGALAAHGLSKRLAPPHTQTDQLNTGHDLSHDITIGFSQKIKLFRLRLHIDNGFKIAYLIHLLESGFARSPQVVSATFCTWLVLVLVSILKSILTGLQFPTQLIRCV
jgi:hypothetical protein